MKTIESTNQTFESMQTIADREEMKQFQADEEAFGIWEAITRANERLKR